MQSLVLVNETLGVVTESKGFLWCSNLYVSVNSSDFRYLARSYFLNLVNKALQRQNIRDEPIQELAVAKTGRLEYTF